MSDSGRWERLVYTSVDDCRSSLRHCTKEDLPILELALKAASRLPDQKTRAKLLLSRIIQLEKGK